MKKYISILFFVCLSVLCMSAQQATFLGLNIEGKQTDFKQKLIEKGFTILDESPEGDLLEGRFTGKNVIVNIAPGLDDNVALVGVYLPVEESWAGVTNEFSHYVDLYNNKYGEPFITDYELAGLTPSTAAFKEAIEDGQVLVRNIYTVGNIFVSIIIQNAVTEESDGYQLMILYINDDNFVDDDDTESTRYAGDYYDDI